MLFLSFIWQLATGNSALLQLQRHTPLCGSGSTDASV
jgi:hypothetical protein